jgi:pimeloyl-ACP methyl ester carboxylesterase
MRPVSGELTLLYLLQDSFELIQTLCHHLQVPLDYSDPDGRDAAIALIRKPATTKEGYRGPILFNPGGPGGSGVDLILALGDAFATILGSQFDIVSFDPRGMSDAVFTVTTE